MRGKVFCLFTFKINHGFHKIGLAHRSFFSLWLKKHLCHLCRSVAKMVFFVPFVVNSS